ncbi:MAG: YggT family protein [Pseudomonadota bacterium]
MSSFLTIFNMLVNLVFWIIIIQAILSWLIAFQVVNMHQPLVRQIWGSLNALTEPIYRPIRRMLPNMGGIDITPLIVLLGIYSLQIIVNNNLGSLAY